MYIINKIIVNEMYKHAEEEAPLEACGYLAGNGNVIKKLYRMVNRDKSEEHFSFIPEEQFAVVKDARKKNLQLVGVYHSHPETKARLSQEDIRLANDSDILYLVISLVSRPCEIRGFRVKDKEVCEVEIKIIK